MDIEQTLAEHGEGDLKVSNKIIKYSESESFLDTQDAAWRARIVSEKEGGLTGEQYMRKHDMQIGDDDLLHVHDTRLCEKSFKFNTAVEELGYAVLAM